MDSWRSMSKIRIQRYVFSLVFLNRSAIEMSMKQSRDVHDQVGALWNNSSRVGVPFSVPTELELEVLSPHTCDILVASLQLDIASNTGNCNEFILRVSQLTT